MKEVSKNIGKVIYVCFTGPYRGRIIDTVGETIHEDLSQLKDKSSEIKEEDDEKDPA
jgi:beta-lactam-binding protein with PASTA domain